MPTIIRLLVAVMLVGAAGSASAQPSSTLTDYVLFGQTWLKAKYLLVPCGSIGVNQASGLLRTTVGVTVAGDCVGDIARMDLLGSCGQIFANSVINPPESPIAFTPPVLSGTIASNCGFPGSFPVCDLFTPVSVSAGTTTSLPPGTYGNLTVEGGYDPTTLLPNPGILQLQGGSYTFCNVKLSRFAELRALAPVTINVNGNLKMQGTNYFGPDTGSLASDVVVYVNGTKARYARDSQAIARLCAPNGRCGLATGGNHAGWVWCDRVKTDDITFTCASPSAAFVD
jgi:hypothetical protein